MPHEIRKRSTWTVKKGLRRPAALGVNSHIDTWMQTLFDEEPIKAGQRLELSLISGNGSEIKVSASPRHDKGNDLLPIPLRLELFHSVEQEFPSSENNCNGVPISCLSICAESSNS